MVLANCELGQTSTENIRGQSGVVSTVQYELDKIVDAANAGFKENLRHKTVMKYRVLKSTRNMMFPHGSKQSLHKTNEINDRVFFSYLKLYVHIQGNKFEFG